MTSNTFTAQLARTHRLDLQREAGARSLARKIRLGRKGRTSSSNTTSGSPSGRNRRRRSGNDFSWNTVEGWHVAAAH